jgi:PBP1b-binding outer membrane lipoprotein LpoB
MKRTIALIIAGVAIFLGSCGQNAAEKAAAEQARIDSIAQAEAAAAKQAILDSIAQAEEAAAAQAKLDSMQAALEEANLKAEAAKKTVVSTTKKVTEPVKEEPVQAKPSRSGATKRTE